MKGECCTKWLRILSVLPKYCTCSSVFFRYSHYSHHSPLIFAISQKFLDVLRTVRSRSLLALSIFTQFALTAFIVCLPSLHCAYRPLCLAASLLNRHHWPGMIKLHFLIKLSVFSSSRMRLGTFAVLDQRYYLGNYSRTLQNHFSNCFQAELPLERSISSSISSRRFLH